MTENPLKKYQASFTRTEKNLKELPVIGGDTEDNSKGLVTLIAFVGDFGESPNKLGKFVTKHAKKAIDFIYSIETPTYFVFHNLEYDVINIFKHDDYIQIEDMVYSGVRLLKMTLKGCPHTFVDSGAFFKGPLKALAEFVGKKKLKGSSMSVKYILRDAEIPYLFLKGFQQRLVKNEGVNLGITIGQLAMEIYRRKYMLTKTQFTYNSPNCFKAYYGGRVEAFYLGDLQNEIHVSDINSSYPDAMKNNLYPDTGTIVPSTLGTHNFGIGRFRVRVPDSQFIPVLPLKEEKSGRLFFPKGEFTGWWSYPEIRYAVECGTEILEEYEGEGTNSGCAPFVDYITDFYDKRLVAKNTSNQFDDLLYKLIQNNLYGKFFQWRGGNRMTRDPLPTHEIEKYFDHPEFDTKKVGPFYWYHLPKMEPPKHANFMWGLYITAYARIKLHKALNSAYQVGYTPIYCDTDSIMYSNLSSKKLPEPNIPISKKLGDWDKESFDLGIFRQAKAYILYNKDPTHLFRYLPVKMACKGVPTHYAHEFIIEALAKYQKPVRLKEGLMRTYADVNQDKSKSFLHDLGANIWKDVTKEMKSIYIKRKGSKGVTYPQDAKDLKAIVKDSLARERLDYIEETKAYWLEKPEKPDAFKHEKIPKNYFDGEPPRNYDKPDFYPNKPYRLQISHLESMKKGAVWFRGVPMRIVRTIKGGREPLQAIPEKPKDKLYVQILMKELFGEKMPENFIAEINYKIIEGFFDENKMGRKNLEIFLQENYVKNEFPKIGSLL